MSPAECTELVVRTKQPGLELEARESVLRAEYATADDREASAYESLLLDVLEGDHTPFLRFDEVEWSWRIVDPILNAWKHGAPEDYVAGSDGPPGQHRFLGPGHYWRPLREPHLLSRNLLKPAWLIARRFPPRFGYTGTGHVASRRWLCRFTNVPSASRPPRPFGLAAAIAGFLGHRSPDRDRVLRRQPTRSARHARPRIVVRSPKALRYVLTAPGEIGFARAYVAGEIDVEGDIFEALSLRDHLPDVKVTPREWLALARAGRRRRVCSRSRRRPRRRGCAAAGTARSATRRRSRTTTTCRTTSTGWCSDRR